MDSDFGMTKLGKARKHCPASWSLVDRMLFFGWKKTDEGCWDTGD